jgi:hypothetical protein
MRKLFLALGLVMFFSVSSAFGDFISDIGFPYKGFIYSALNISTSDRTNVQVDLQTPDRFQFTYQGKKYKAELYRYGAIYLEREGKNPLLISFDVKEFRLNGRYVF